MEHSVAYSPPSSKISPRLRPHSPRQHGLTLQQELNHGQPLLQQRNSLEQIRQLQETEITDDIQEQEKLLEEQMVIDEIQHKDDEIIANVDEIDENLPVDDEFQKTLNQRAEEIMSSPEKFRFGHGESISSFSIPKPKAEYAFNVMAPFDVEIDEWFSASDYSKFPQTRTEFQQYYEAKKMNNQEYAAKVLDSIKKSLQKTPQDLSKLLALTYIVFGLFEDVSGKKQHMDAVRKNVRMVVEHPGMLEVLVKVMKQHCDWCVVESLIVFPTLLQYSLTVVYFIVCVLAETPIDAAVECFERTELLEYLVKYIEKWRWNSKMSMRIRSVIAILNKLLLVQFGNLEKHAGVKKSLYKKYGLKRSNKLTVSPLDYHVFREDIVARYPGFEPPESTLPMEFDNSLSLSQFLEVPRPKVSQSLNNSLPVPDLHISTTPAPSPPSSPQLKTKRSFQTNMAFPFIHPAGIDAVPYSIQEATEIISNSIEEKLSTKQLWETREKFMKQERGWVSYEESFSKYSDHGDATLARVEKFYRSVLPELTSLVHVLTQIVESNSANFEVLEHEQHMYPDHNDLMAQLEVTRAKEIAMKSAAGSLLLLTKWLRLSHILKGEHFCTLLYDAKFMDSGLRFLTSVTNSYFDRVYNRMLKPRHSFWKECGMLSSCYRESTPPPTPEFDSMSLCCSISVLHVLAKVISTKTQRLKDLPLNIGVLFKQLFQVFNLDMYHPVLKIVMAITPFKSKKWKADHMDLISAVYLYKKLPLGDNWLNGKDIAGEVGDAYGQEVALRALLQFYNFYHYRFSMESFGYTQKNNDFFTTEADALC